MSASAILVAIIIKAWIAFGGTLGWVWDVIASPFTLGEAVIMFVLMTLVLLGVQNR